MKFNEVVAKKDLEKENFEINVDDHKFKSTENINLNYQNKPNVLSMLFSSSTFC